jgi:hypothetical protein
VLDIPFPDGKRFRLFGPKCLRSDSDLAFLNSNKRAGAKEENPFLMGQMAGYMHAQCKSKFYGNLIRYIVFLSTVMISILEFMRIYQKNTTFNSICCS